MLPWVIMCFIMATSTAANGSTKPTTTQQKVVWVCKGNSYMVLKKGFKPEKHRGCRPTKMKVESDKP